MPLCHLILVQHEDEETGRLILRYCGAKNCLVSVMKTALNIEIRKTPSSEVLFREESAATKLMYTLFFSQWGGNEYLNQVVRPTLQSISKSLFGTEEVNVESGTHVNEIRRICDEFLKRVKNSTHLFPLYVQKILLAKLILT